MSVTEPARVYTVSGGGSRSKNSVGSANSTSLPDLLRRSGSSNKRKKRRTAEAVDDELSRIELIQDFEFPEASNKITSTRDGLHVVATGTYKPQMRVWECEQLSLKFERHTDAENVDFKMLSDDWTKSIHLQSDRSLEVHAQGGTHARIRIPKFGRSIGYHFPSAEALVGAAGKEVYRLNLDQGRFLSPFVLGESAASTSGNEVTGCNVVDVNPAHGLLAFGTEGGGVVELWDPRSRKRAGKVSILTSAVLDAALSSSRRGLPALALPGEDADALALSNAVASLSVTALASAEDGLNLAVGTSTGHVLLYDLRMERPYTTKDQGFSLPIKSLSWQEGVSGGGRTRTEADGKVMSADSKVVKVWDRHTGENLVSISPPAGSAATDLNDVHQVSGSGLLLAAVEGTQMAAWYVPALGPAPRWCSFLDTITDEMDEMEGGSAKKGVYEDFKFVDAKELERLELTHLIGTSLLRPYMHGYFLALGLYDKARLLSNPTAYADARERAIKARLDKQAESRIRTAHNAPRKALVVGEGKKVVVNKDLAEKLARDAVAEEAKRLKKEARAKSRAESTDETGTNSTAASAVRASTSANLLNDPRFSELFTNPEYQVDQDSREFAMLHPSGAGDKKLRDGPRKLTAVEEEDAASEIESLDPDEDSESAASDDDGGDSSDDNDLGQYDPRSRAAAPRRSGPRLVDDDEEVGGYGIDEDPGAEGNQAAAAWHAARHRGGARKRTFEERKREGTQGSGGRGRRGARGGGEGTTGRSMTWTPGASALDESAEGRERGGSNSARGSARGRGRGAKDKTFGHGLSRGAGSEQGVGVEGLAYEQRFGREKRRKPERSASGNVMRGR